MITDTILDNAEAMQKFKSQVGKSKRKNAIGDEEERDATLDIVATAGKGLLDSSSVSFCYSDFLHFARMTPSKIELDYQLLQNYFDKLVRFLLKEEKIKQISPAVMDEPYYQKIC
jgi:hypothetical protein